MHNIEEDPCITGQAKGCDPQKLPCKAYMACALNGDWECCDSDPPPEDEEPFWIYDEGIYSTYNKCTVFEKNILLPGEETLLKIHVDHVKNFDKRQHSRRFKKVELSFRVQVDPVPIKSRTSAYNNKYRYKSFMASGTTLSEKEDSVESTIAELFGSGDQSQPVAADLPGVSTEARETLCVRLDLAEPVDHKPGWQAFATKIMDISYDDITLFDECRCQYWYVINIMELVLYHWAKLYRLKSPKCLLTPEKDSIKNVLIQMEKIDLIHKLKWAQLPD